MAQVVESFVSHAPGEGAVTDYSNNMAPVSRLAFVARHCHAVGIRQHRRCVTIFNEVVHAFFTAGVSRKPASLAQLCKPAPSTCNQFVNVGLVPGVPQDGVAWRLEHSMQRQGELDRAEVRTQMPAGFGYRCNDEVANLTCQLV